jgi:cytochrome c553
MRPRENYTPFITAGLSLTLAILATFQVYIWREPTHSGCRGGRSVGGRNSRAHLYADNCAACHGENGEGKTGPALIHGNCSRQRRMNAVQPDPHGVPAR